MGILGDAWDALTGKNQANGGNDVNPYQTDPNAFQYGGQPGGAQKQAGIYGNVANNYTQGAYGNFTTAGNALGQSQQARDEQMQALQLAKGRANGQNLIANQVTAQQQQRAAAEQAGIAASARGPAALAAAQQNRAAGAAQASAQLGAQGAIAASQEQLANQNAYANQAAGIRAGDVGTAGTAGSIGAQQGGLGLGYAGLENDVNKSNLTASMNREALNSGNYNAAHGLNAQVGAANASNKQGAVLGLAQGATSSLAGAVAHGGGVHGGQPYLVGEKGPELVVPNRDGWVMTAQQTAALLGAPPTHQQMMALAHGQRAAGGPMYPARDAGGPIDVAPFTGANATTGAAPTWGNAAAYPRPSQVAQAAAPPPPSPGPLTTWGSAVPSLEEQQRAFDAIELQRAAKESMAYDPTNTPATRASAQRAKDTLATGEKVRALGIAPKKGSAEQLDQAAAERQARYTLGKEPEQDAAQAKEAKALAKTPEPPPEAKKKPGALGLVAGIANDAAKSSAASKQPITIGGGYSTPQLLALPQRAFGGPVDAGPEMDVSQPGSDVGMKVGMGGGREGLDVKGSLAATNAIDTQFMKHPGGMGGYAREEGGPLAAIAEHGSRLIHHLANAVAVATEPDAIAIERKTPRPAETSKTGFKSTGTDAPGAVHSPTTATLARPGPKEYPEKVTRARDDEDPPARAWGGPMLARGKKRCA